MKDGGTVDCIAAYVPQHDEVNLLSVVYVRRQIDEVFAAASRNVASVCSLA